MFLLNIVVYAYQGGELINPSINIEALEWKKNYYIHTGATA